MFGGYPYFGNTHISILYSVIVNDSIINFVVYHIYGESSEKGRCKGFSMRRLMGRQWIVSVKVFVRIRESFLWLPFWHVLAKVCVNIWFWELLFHSVSFFLGLSGTNLSGIYIQEIHQSCCFASGVALPVDLFAKVLGKHWRKTAFSWKQTVDLARRG